MAIYRIGDIVSFSYNGQYSTDFYPRVLILHDGWKEKNTGKIFVHAVNLNALTDIEQKKLKDSITASANSMKSGAKKHNIMNPYDFYKNFISFFATQTGSYRKYYPQKMVNVKVLDKREKLFGEALNHYIAHMSTLEG